VTALALALVAAACTALAAAPATAAGTPLLDLPGIHRSFSLLAPERAFDVGERAAAFADLSLLVAAIAGDALPVQALSTGDMTSGSAATTRIVVTPAIARRDGAAYQLLAVGYSARETADVLSGRISRHALDTARKMIMAGLGRDAAAEYLDRECRRFTQTTPNTQRHRLDGWCSLGVRCGSGDTAALASAIARYASAHAVDAAIVNAVVDVESRFDPAARSRAGAIGLMQLMPATARELGVNPWIPEQNIEGGVRYLAALMRMFGEVELALVAYNGGPGYARRYARGEAPLYGETREYVRQVLARLPAPR
jgi:soluble lytic murein transglycosylase-like protein